MSPMLVDIAAALFLLLVVAVLFLVFVVADVIAAQGIGRVYDEALRIVPSGRSDPPAAIGVGNAAICSAGSHTFTNLEVCTTCGATRRPRPVSSADR